ncbi:MAG: hypothetical protein WC624_02640 [Candidatus Margulisiibacteriota bacterium]
MDILQLLSTLLEVGVVVLGGMIVLYKKKNYGWFIALTFGIYVIYDLAKIYSWNIDANALNSLFFIASVSIYWALWEVYKNI